MSAADVVYVVYSILYARSRSRSGMEKDIIDLGGMGMWITNEEEERLARDVCNGMRKGR